MGTKEINRLNRVPDLGVATAVFSGINHSRLEYMWLQCAVVTQVAKIHKDNQEIALSNTVKINGLETPISSGEELLKVWFLLSNYGHTQWTYGVERTLLLLAQTNKNLRKWLTRGISLRDISKWSEQVINNYDDRQMHFVLSLLRISYLSPRDRRKKIFTHYLRNLLLPIDILFPEDPTAKHKLLRLRMLFERIRLLCLVTLDSYYSHHPIKLEIQSVLNDIANFSTPLESEHSFADTLKQVAAWLADELYLYPSALAVQREYEVRKPEIIIRRFNRFRNSKDAMVKFLNDFMNQGFGHPKVGTLLPLLRLSFSKPRQSLLGSQNNFQLLNHLCKELVRPPATQISIDRNPFSGDIHIDFFLNRHLASTHHVASVFVSLRRWLIRSVEAEGLRHYREMFRGLPKNLIQTQTVLRQKIFERILTVENTRLQNVLQSIFQGVIRYILPENWNGSISEYLPSHNPYPPILALIRYKEGIYDQVTSELNKQLYVNPHNLSLDRLQELEAIRFALNQSNAPFILVCFEKFIVSDQIGKTRDEWDGLMIEIDDKAVCFTVIEAKKGRSSGNRANNAFKQLDETRKICCIRNKLMYRRKRLANYGAKLTLKLSVEENK